MKINGLAADQITRLKDSATKSEKQLIDIIEKMNIDELIYKSITELSDVTGVAEATIVRFCRKMGFKGFQDFKLKISKDAFFNTESRIDSIPLGIAHGMNDAVNLSAENIDYEECKKIAELIISARKVCAFGAANSNIAAQSLRNRLMKTGINVDTAFDPHFQNIIAANMSEKDLLILISVSGSTKDLLEIADIAKSAGTPIVLITNSSKSPLGSRADYILYGSKRESPLEGGSFATMAAQLFVVSVLCAAVYRMLGEGGKEAAERATASVTDKML